MRVVRSFAFVDLCGFTSYTSTEGDDQATNVLASFRACLRDIASRRGVRVAKWLGDGAMIVSVEAEPLVSAVLEIERRVDDGSSPLPIRAGMTRGHVILFEGDDYIGSPVNLASRLCDEAAARQVLATPDLAAYRPSWAAIDEPRPVRVAGFAAPVDIVFVTRRPPGPHPVTDPICGLVLPFDATIGGQFCSESCAASWSDQHGRSMPEAP